MTQRRSTAAGRRQFAGIFVGGFGVAAVLRVAFDEGGGALLLIGLVCLLAGAFLIFRNHRL